MVMPLQGPPACCFPQLTAWHHKRHEGQACASSAGHTPLTRGRHECPAERPFWRPQSGRRRAQSPGWLSRAARTAGPPSTPSPFLRQPGQRHVVKAAPARSTCSCGNGTHTLQGHLPHHPQATQTGMGEAVSANHTDMRGKAGQPQPKSHIQCQHARSEDLPARGRNPPPAGPPRAQP